MTFQTTYKHFKYLIISFEFVNVLTTFQIFVNKTLIKFVDVIYVMYLNDIFIFSRNKKSHIEHVKNLRKHDLFCKMSKL